MQVLPDPHAGQETPQTTHLTIRTRLMAHVEAWRLDLSTYAGIVSLGGALLASEHRVTWRLVGAWLAPTLGWLAAMYGGDYFDRDLDAVAKPHRPIPSGRMTATGALAGMVICVLLGMAVSVLLNPFNLAVVAITLALGVGYSRYLKARGVWGNLIRGGVTAMAFVHGTLATSHTPPLALLPVALVFWLHDSGSNVVGAICDRDGDRAGGYRTVPVRYGDRVALWLLVAFDAGWVALAALYPTTAVHGFHTVRYLPFLAVAVVMGTVTVVRLFRAPRPIPRLVALRAHEILVVERLILAAGLVAAAASVVLALALLIPAAGATVAASVGLMRSRYEPTRARARGKAA